MIIREIYGVVFSFGKKILNEITGLKGGEAQKMPPCYGGWGFRPLLPEKQD